MRRACLAAALLLAAPVARAESDRWGTFELRLSGYRPSVDSEFSGGVHPYADVFGNSRGLMFRAEFAKSLFTTWGTLDLGVGAGYWSQTGHGTISGTTTLSADETSFKIIPLSLSLTYRFDLLVERYGIPFAPYLRASLLRYQWWVTNGAGDTAAVGTASGSGATNGYAFTAGLAFLLDYLDPTIAKEMDRDSGLNHVYIFVDVTKTYVNDFDSATSWNLSDPHPVWTGGLLFVF